MRRASLTRLSFAGTLLAGTAVLVLAASEGAAQSLALPDLSTETTPAASQRGLAEPGLPTRTVDSADPVNADSFVLRPGVDATRPASIEEGEAEPSFDLFAGPEEAQAPEIGPTNTRAEAASPSAAAIDRLLGETVPGRPAQPLLRAANPPLSAGISGELQSGFDAGRATRSSTALEQILRRPEGDPFAPVGIVAGRFVLFPELIQTLGLSSNLDNRPGGKGGAFSETTLSARLLSDFAENEAELNAALTYRRNFAGDNPSDPRATLDGRYRLDIDRLTRATLRGALEYREEDGDDIVSDLSADTRSGQSERLLGSLSLDLERDLGRFTLRGTGTAARSTLDTERPGAANEDYTTLTAGLRLGYELSPALRPFVEASLGRRLFDEPTLPGGDIDRDALIPSGRVGLALDLSEKLAGEIALGYASSRPDDDRLEARGATTIDASLAWSPLRGTDITLGARTGFEPDSAGSSANVDYETSLRLRHILTTRLDLLGGLIAELSDDTRPGADETTYTAELGFNYWINRAIALTALVSHSRIDADRPGDSYDATGIRVGLRFQR